MCIRDSIDVSLPVTSKGVSGEQGSLHPLSIVESDLNKIFKKLGFHLVDGPHVESEYYNFDALNMPEVHPARDMQDTFWTSDGDVLRTQTSALQARALYDLAQEGKEPPLRLVGPGRVFRNERTDASHDHTFYQMEGLMIDKNINVGHMLYYVNTLLSEIYKTEIKTRLRPGYFPFVEPGFELDVWFNGKWLEMCPCGLVHPKVIENAGFDSKEWQGFAFGLGLSRLVMGKYLSLIHI